MTFEAEKPGDFPNLQRLCPYDCKLAAVRNVFRGRRSDVEAISFDCIVRCRNARIMGDPQTTIACFRMRGKNLPWFSLEPETSHNSLPVRAAIPGGGVRLDSVPEFSRSFLARTRDHLSRCGSSYCVVHGRIADGRPCCKDGRCAQLRRSVRTVGFA